MTEDVYLRTVPVMGTLVTIQVGHAHGCDPNTQCAVQSAAQRQEAVERAFAWFYRIEECCSRFEPQSEVTRLVAQIGVPTPVSAILFEAAQFALAVAEESGGAFDPTVGYRMESRGFNREYRSGRMIQTTLEEPGAPVTYRDVRLDPERQTVTLLRPLLLDLGAVAKGLAIDTAARELQAFENFAIDAGGDLYLAGCNPNGAPWSVGIRHPRSAGELIDSLRVSNRAVCTSGDYERRIASETDGEIASEINGHHILDPRTGASAHASISATVLAPKAMLADALATAAFVLGPTDGIRLLDRLGLDGLIISPTLEKHWTRGMCGDYTLSDSAILSDAQGPSHHRPGDSGSPSRAD